MEKTTIQVNSETLERLKSLKRFERQSYDEILNTLIDNSEESLTDEEIKEIEKGLEDVKKNRTQPIESVADEMGIKLE